MSATPTITVVMPVYNEASHIYENVLRVDAVLTDAGIVHGFVLTNDGSSDGTWGELSRLATSLSGVTIADLSRNFGKEAALCAGIGLAKGEAVVTIDADLQHPPEVIVEMVRLWREEGFDVVEGVKRDRGKQSAILKLGAASFYKVFSALTGLDLDQATDFKLLDRRVVDAWGRLNETNTFFRGMTSWVGYKHCEVPFDVDDRLQGRSGWSFGKLVAYAIHSTASFTSVPLYVISYMGAVFCVLAVALGIETLWNKFAGVAVGGFTTVIILLLIIGGLIMVNLGIIGVYLSKIYEETKARPRFIISEIKGAGTDE